MGGRNQATFLTSFVKRDFPQRGVEIGSKDYGNTVPWRTYFKDAQYTGVDMEAGPGVDVVADVTQGVDGLPMGVDLVICCSVLEHVRKPWLAAPNIESLLRPGGLLYVVVPWVWRYHPYPDDYFRYSFNGIRALFEQTDDWKQFYSTNVDGDFMPAEQGTDNGRSMVDDESGVKFLPYLEIHSLGVKRGD